MLHTRFTPEGKPKGQNRFAPAQILSVLSCLVFLAVFCTVGLRFTYVPPKDLRSAVAVSTRPMLPQLPAGPAAENAGSTVENGEPMSTPRPALAPGVTLTEDAENGRWFYEDDRLSLQISRTQPRDHVVATVAFITPKDGTCPIRTAFAEGLFGQNVRARTREIAAEVGAIFAINGDYCGYRSDGIIIRDGQSIRDVPVRQMLWLGADGQLHIAQENETTAQALLEQGAVESWSFGPALVENDQIPEVFHTDVPGENPRTAFGQRQDGTFVAVVVDGRLSGYSEGLNMHDLAQYMLDLGCVTAYNLDGGMTSCMYFNGRVISTPCGTANKERALSDILYIGSEN